MLPASLPLLFAYLFCIAIFATANPMHDVLLNKRCIPSPDSIPGITAELSAKIKAQAPGTEWCPFDPNAVV